VRYTIHSRVLPAPAPRLILEKEPGVHATQYLGSRLTQTRVPPALLRRVPPQWMQMETRHVIRSISMTGCNAVDGGAIHDPERPPLPPTHQCHW
jgi:hypothetical protein